MNEWLLVNAKWAIVEQYHGENKFHFDEMMIPTDDDVHTQKHINLILSQPVFVPLLLNAARFS
jgi:hypothetical protein